MNFDDLTPEQKERRRQRRPPRRFWHLRKRKAMNSPSMIWKAFPVASIGLAVATKGIPTTP